MRDADRTFDMTSSAGSDPSTIIKRGRDDCIELLPGSVVDEIYEIDAKLGAGSMGDVYAARHLKLGKSVAIKVIGQRISKDDAAIERFAQEAQTLAQLQHPAIVAVDHVGELADGRAYFVMEYLRGEALYARLARGRVPLDEALRILDQMARGLEAAHAQGVIHRDLKPENTFLARIVNEAPIVKLLDFGLAKLAVDVDRRAERTQSGVALGTPMYMSPEQVRGAAVDHRTDIYALGCVAYELLLGRRPFDHTRTIAELYASHLHATAPLPRSIWPEIPAQLDLVLFAMLAKDPAHRPTLPQVRLVIATVATARASSPHVEAATVLVPRSPRMRLRALMIAGAAMISGVAMGATAMRGCNEPGELAGLTGHADAAARDSASTVVLPKIDANLDAAMPTRPRADGAVTAIVLRDAGVVRPTPPKADGRAATAGEATQPRVDADASETPRTIDHPDHRPPRKPAPLGRNQPVNPFATKRVRP